MLNAKPHIYTVSEITREIKSLMENGFSNIWIEGEISNISRPSSGHIYFSLKDNQSQIKIVLFRSYLNTIRFKLEDGLHIVLFGSVSLYEKRGEYQILATYLEPKGVGAMQLAFEQLKKKLKDEGLFEPSHKKPIPFLPRKIGIITSPTGAAIHDLIKVINNRFPNVFIVIYGVRVQGEGAASEIAAAIHEANQDKTIDVLIIGRGGGSIEDLWAFNEEIVARSIYNSSIPVISAVGHEIDYSISDFVADLRAPTPSVAGEFVVPDKKNLVKELKNLSVHLNQAVHNLIDFKKIHLKNIIQSSIFSLPKKRINDYRMQISDMQDHMYNIFCSSITLRKKSIQDIIKKLAILNPFEILKRGYSLSFLLPDEIMLKDIMQVKMGDKIKVKLYNGELFCHVEKVQR